MTSVAVIGAGYAGIATTWHLLQYPKITVTLFDPSGIAGGASGLSAGLLHPYAGAHAKLNPRGKEGIAETTHLLEVAKQYSSAPVMKKTGMLRLALTEQQKIDFKAAAENYSDDIRWCEPEESIQLVPGITPLPGIFIKSAAVVSPKAYLQALWLACQDKGANLDSKQITELSELAQFDVIVVCTGIATIKYPELQHLPLKPLKGQLIELEWPQDVPPLQMPLNSSKYLVMTSDNKRCLAGATFERRFMDAAPDLEFAKADILPELFEILPILRQARVLDCKAGLRVFTPDHQPLVKQVAERVWVFTGLGSKGLLYHALLAKRLAWAIAGEK